MNSFIKRRKSCECGDVVLSVSLGHGFPWGDVADCGAKLWVVTDNDAEKAAELALQLGREFWNIRNESYRPPVSVAAAMAPVAASHGGPIVLADVGANAGGGAKIGRASGRERVCQCGWISGGAVYLNKNYRTKTWIHVVY